MAPMETMVLRLVEVQCFVDEFEEQVDVCNSCDYPLFKVLGLLVDVNKI